MEWVMITIVCCLCVFAVVYVLRHSISGILVSRTGFQLFTNSISVQFEIAGTIERIDSATKKAVRKATVTLKLLDPKKYGMTPEVLLVNHEAVLPLTYAAYENHHARELFAQKTAGYIAEKMHDVMEAIRAWQHDIPDLNEELIEMFVCHWIRHAVILNVIGSCHEKVAYYKTLLQRNDMIEGLKQPIKAWLEKNEQYIQELSELSDCTDSKLTKIHFHSNTTPIQGESP